MSLTIQHTREEREQGFTLSELLVVILIMGVLAAITVPAFANQRRNSVDSSVKTDITNAVKQLETWMIRYPATPIPTVTATSSGSSSNAVSIRNIKASEGTTLVISPIAGRPGNFTVSGKNAAGKKASTTAGYIYDSTKGGFQ